MLKGPWVAGSLYNAFNASKNRALGRMYEQSVSRYPLPWLTTYARRMRDMFGGDPFPFGIEENRPTFEQFLRYVFEQGIAHRHAKVEDSEMFEVFNMGVGFCYVVDPASAERALAILRAHGREAQRIGTAVSDAQKIVRIPGRGLAGQHKRFWREGGATRRVG